MIRRRKIQARPNVSSASSVPQAHSSLVDHKIDHKGQAQQERESNTPSATPPTPAAQQNVIVEQTVPSANDFQQQQSETPEATVDGAVAAPSQLVPSTSESAPALAPTDIQQQIVALGEAPNEQQQNKDVHPALEAQSQPHSSLEAQQSLQRKQRKEPPKDKLCDQKKFTMADLISWRPKTENTLRKKRAEKRKLLKEIEIIKDLEVEGTTEVDNDGSNEKLDKKAKAALGKQKAAAAVGEEGSKTAKGPRVKINEDGEMVVDETSLVVVENPENNPMETVNDDFIPKKLSSMSFKKFKKGSVWSVLETDLFYEVLAATGTDFGLMHEFIPARTRAELKLKFNREQRANARRLDEALRNPVLLDERLRMRVERMLEEMAKRI